MMGPDKERENTPMASLASAVISAICKAFSPQEKKYENTIKMFIQKTPTNLTLNLGPFPEAWLFQSKRGKAYIEFSLDFSDEIPKNHILHMATRIISNKETKLNCQ